MKTLLRLAIVCLISMLATKLVWAQLTNSNSTVEVGVVPEDPAKTAGFECVVELASGVRPGYVALNFAFSLPVAATSERSLVARVRPRSTGMLPQRNMIEVELPLVIEQDVSGVEIRRFIPKWMFGSSFAIEFYEGGRSLDGYSLEFGNDGLARKVFEQTILQEISTQCLLVEPSIQPNVARDTSPKASLSEIQTWLQNNLVEEAQSVYPGGFRGSRVRLIQGARQDAGNFVSLVEDDLPTDWREFQSFNLVVMDASTFERLQEKPSSKFAALNQWLLLGGNVLLRDMDPKFGLSAMLGRDVSGIKQDSEGQKRLQSVISNFVETMGKSGFSPPPTQPGATSSEETPDGARDERFTQLSKRGEALMADLVSDRVAIQCESVGAGRVVAFRSDFAESSVSWLIAKELLGRSSSPVLRRGVDPLFGDARFRRWLIPGVAQPPVYTFMGLLTLFVMLVGPVAYRYTTRHGRGYLMFAIAPVLAVLTTLSMFAYGIVSDGFGTVARIRQITWVDGVTGDSVTRNRGTYFAGIRPAEGLRFDADAEVMWYPDFLDLSPNEVVQLQSPPLGNVTIDEANQRFSSSFLPSRQQRQFVVHQAIPGVGTLSAKRIESGVERIESGSSGGNATLGVILEIKNNLKMDLSQVVVCDAKGDFWSVGQLPSNAVVRVESQVALKDRSKLLGDLYNVQRMLEENSGAARTQRRSQAFDLIATLNQMDSSSSREVTDGTMEQWLREHLQLGGSLSPGMFVGLASIDARFVATANTELVDSVHFVIGTMP